MSNCLKTFHGFPFLCWPQGLKFYNEIIELFRVQIQASCLDTLLDGPADDHPPPHALEEIDPDPLFFAGVVFRRLEFNYKAAESSTGHRQPQIQDSSTNALSVQLGPRACVSNLTVGRMKERNCLRLDLYGAPADSNAPGQFDRHVWPLLPVGPAPFYKGFVDSQLCGVAPGHCSIFLKALPGFRVRSAAVVLAPACPRLPLAHRRCFCLQLSRQIPLLRNLLR